MSDVEHDGCFVVGREITAESAPRITKCPWWIVAAVWAPSFLLGDWASTVCSMAFGALFAGTLGLAVFWWAKMKGWKRA